MIWETTFDVAPHSAAPARPDRATLRGVHRVVASLRGLALAMGGVLLALLLVSGSVAWAGRSPVATGPSIDTVRLPAIQAPPGSEQNVALHACLARVAQGDSPATRLASMAGFDCISRPVALGPGSYWVRLRPQDITQPLASLPPGLSVLSFVARWQRDAALYVHHIDGSISMMPLGNRDLSRLTHVGARIQVRLHDRAAPADGLLLRIDGAINTNGLLNEPLLLSEASSTRSDVSETAIYCTFAGVCLALLVLNLALLVSMREGFQMTYCLMVIGMLTYAWSYSGGWSLWFPDRDITERFRLSYISLGVTAALTLRFFVDFLERDALPGWVRWLASAQRLALLGVAAATVVTTAPAWLYRLDRMSIWAFVGLMAVAVIMTVSALFRGSRAARVLLLTWTLPLLGGIMRLSHELHLITYTPLSEHSPLLAMGFNAMLSSLAIALRVKVLAEERDSARNDERLARRLADMDPLTGLLNRRGLLAQVTEDGALGSLRLLIVDVDHFKAINDTHGHDIGDEVLRELARVLTRRGARRGRVARLGGEEFAIVGAAGDLSPALALAVLSDVRQHRFPGGIRVTVSIGMAEGEIRTSRDGALGAQGEADWSVLYRRADTALYEAKTTGRNRVVDAALMEAGLGGFGTLPPEVLAAG